MKSLRIALDGRIRARHGPQRRSRPAFWRCAMLIRLGVLARLRTASNGRATPVQRSRVSATRTYFGSERSENPYASVKARYNEGYCRAEQTPKRIPNMGKRAVRLRNRGAKVSAPPVAARRAETPRKRLRPPRLLTYVDAVARHGSIRKAAEALNVASSALNRQILDLELDLGSDLFERLPRGVRLTAAREAFLAYTRQAISELKAVESQVEQLRGLVRGQVGVAAVESVAGELLPAAITQFQVTHPNVRFNVRIGAPDDLIAGLTADQVDLILTHY